jgi:hypothetical protein
MTVAERIAVLDAEWYSRVLRAGGHAEAAVTEVAAEPLSFSGTAGDIARVRLTYDAEGSPGPRSVIAKIRGAADVQAAVDAAMGLYERESRFYADHADAVPVVTPRCYHVGDGTSTPLLIEDLGAMRMGDLVEGLSVADAERVIDALADLHASHWGIDPGEWGWLAAPGEGVYAQMVAQLVQSGTPMLTERFAGRADDRVLEAMGEWAARWETVLARCAEGPPTLVHNDCRLDNLIFRDDETPVFVDWQIVARTRGTTDLGNLLGGSMEPADQAANWESLLRRYHERLLAQGVEGYSWDECVQHYRVSVLYAISPGIAMMGALAAGDERGVAESTALRALEHASDLDSFGALEGE